jgi:phosphoglycolate phosphatase-like HAD superfamily hydrolase
MLVIFDFDGTLIDVGERWYQLHLDIAKKHSLPLIEREAYISAKQEGIKEETLMLNVSDNISAIKAYCKERIVYIENKDYLAFDQPFDGIFKVLDGWSNLGPMCLLSKRRSTENFLWEVESKGFKPLFRDLVPTGGKEKKEVLLNLYSKEVLSSAIIISDAFEDYQTALELGMQPIVIGYGCRSTDYFLKLGVPKVINDCSELIPIATQLKNK